MEHSAEATTQAMAMAGGHDHHNHHDHAAHTQNDPGMNNMNDPQSSHDHHKMMDHNKHAAGGAGSGHGMMMYFHGGFTETILFSFWQIDSIWGLLGSMLGIFLLTVLYEGLKVYREFLLHQTLTSGTVIKSQTATRSGRDLPRLRATSRDGQGNGTTPLAENPEEGAIHENGSYRATSDEIVVVKNVLRPHPLSWPHLLQTLLHVIQLVISYFLMLIFMTYNVWLCVAVALGAGAGYFAFGWRKKTVIDVNECCQ